VKPRMKKLTLKEIAEAVNGRVLKGDGDFYVSGVSTDSRTASSKDIFVALIGEIHDANKFVPQAAKNGCQAGLISDPEAACHIQNAIIVENTTLALQRLAKYYLGLFDLKKIAITGSTGKTTTKDMIYAVMSVKYKTAKTQGNFNNNIGLPLTILSIEEGTEAAVFEMGMDKPGEIDELVDIVRPDIGIITNVGLSHVERLGSRENIFKAKMEIVNYFNSGNVLIICDDGETLTKNRVSGDYKLITIGANGKSSFIVYNVKDNGENGLSFDLEHKQKRQRIELPVPGRHNALNAALAVACGMELGITMEEAANGLSKIVLTEKRLSTINKDGIKVIDDSYNASPDSMRAAIDVLVSRKGLRKVAILGDMFELGSSSPEYHMEIGEYAAKAGVDLVVTIGDLSYNTMLGAKKILSPEQTIHFKNREEFIDKMRDIIRVGDVVLVKGSRAMKMDEITKEILK